LCAKSLILNAFTAKHIRTKKPPFSKGGLEGLSIFFFVRKISDFKLFRSQTYSHKKASLFKGRFGGIVDIFFVRKISDFEVLRSKTYSHKKG